MEVLLKKAKITKSVVTQSLRGNYSFFLNQTGYDVLGWCLMVNGKYKVRWILLYNRDKTNIIRLPYVQDGDYKKISGGIQERDSNGGWIFPTKYWIEVYFRDSSNTTNLFERYTEKETDEDKNKLYAFLREVNTKGQIYI